MATLYVEVTRDQHRIVERAAREMRVSIAAYVRWRLLGLSPGIVIPAVKDVPTPFDGGPAPEGKP